MKTLSFENYQKGKIVENLIELSTEPTIEDFLQRAGETLDLGDFRKVGDFEISTKKCEYHLNTDHYLVKGKEHGHKKHNQWIYIFVIDGRVCKIGQTTVTLTERWVSYSAGTRSSRVKRGTCSTTNYFISEIVRRGLEETLTLEIYGYAIPNTYATGFVFGKETKMLNNHVKYYESRLIEEFFNLYGKKPTVGKNGLVK